ncbi:uncharacterized protein IL334_000265 [Kwoniella shivajii]|uniref:AAA+ ATPase domain-containing protein n=1 Tax=Kwoniella shivajii TaxID=564305 RepID=A0ABZ1CP09_9TREE|nr:hypothetical protein IL334_000265 [Kwoniella shivajii]
MSPPVSNIPASSVPYYPSYPQQPPVQPPQPGLTPNPIYGYQPHQQDIDVSSCPVDQTKGYPTGGGASLNFEQLHQHQHYFQQPSFVNPDQNNRSQTSYPTSYQQPTHPAYHLSQPAYGQHQPYSNSPQPQNYLSQAQPSPYQRLAPQHSLSPAVTGSPGLYSLSPQPTYSQPLPSQPTGAVDPSLVWNQPSQLAPARVISQPQTSIVPHPNPSATTHSVSPIKLKLRLNPPPLSQLPEMAGRSRSAAIVEQVGSYAGRPRRGASQRAQAHMVSYREDDEEELEDAEGEDEEDEEQYNDVKYDLDHKQPATAPRSTRSTRIVKAPERFGDEDDFENKLMPSSPPDPEPRRASGRARKMVVDPDEDEEEFKPPPRNAFPTRATRASIGSTTATQLPSAGPSYTNGNARSSGRNTRQSNKVRHSSADGEDFEPTEDESVDEHISSDPLGNYEDEEEEDDDDLESRSSRGSPRKRSSRNTRSSRTTTRSAPTRRATRNSKRAEPDSDDDYGGGRRNLRARTSRPNYHIPTMDDLSKEISMAEVIAASARPNGRPGGVGGLGAGVRFGASTGNKGLPWSTKGKDLAQAMGDPDTSDSDDFASPLKSGAAGPSMSSAAPVQRTNAVGPSDVPNYGRINPKSNMADADPLGVDMNVTFDNVGGLDDHINQLKEMVALPLLYPELFQQFGVTPPRGVLFHGPPGTGKTLLARALAASCSTGNTKIAFFMRKGADVLSKWVGEAERQLRMLFEEARACQPSIIFFDEIDGIAPVRSSKQDQIHASLVSTLLALMDGMDGRGQVIVIGATNRPDAVDPALRRPGRFDREFYFPLPNRTARKKIIQINTRKWEPQLSDEFLDKLAQLTKGYGGADLRALCTETALNAIQRRYPQIYKTADRLQLETKSIHVSAKDFMMSIKKIVPSSARSTSSAAVQLPSHLVPLLSAPLERIREAIDHVLPPRKHATALEEAEFEEEEGDSFEKHMMLQSLDKLRTFKPRILVHGDAGMGQTYLGPAILHHLEGFHVQSFDLGTLMGDSTKSVEAAVVQLIIEAKRHQPSIIFVPALSAWASTISETARATVRTLLDGIPPSDPILVFGMSDAPVDELPGDVRGLFGFGPENRIELELPTRSERTEYFSDLLTALHRPPTEFPDGVPRRKRVFEELPLAAPLPPRQPTAAELLREEEKDQAARDMIFQSFVHLVRDFLKRHRKVVAGVKEDALAYSNYLAEQAAIASAPAPPPDITDPEIAAIVPTLDGDTAMAIDPSIPTMVADEPLPAVIVSDGTSATISILPAIPTAPAEAVWQAHPVDIDTLQFKLLKHKYYTPSDFLSDIGKIEENAEKLGDPERLARVKEMASSARYHVQGFDQKWIPEFERYKERVMAKKAEKQRKKEEASLAKEKDKKVDDHIAEENGTSQNQPNVNGEGSLKRIREDETEDDPSIQGREKRTKESEVEVEVDANTHTNANEGIEADLNDPYSIANSISANLNRDLDQNQIQLPTTLPSSVTVPSPNANLSSSQLTTIIHPPFIIPEEELKGLKLDLDLVSSTLNIDQLEQMRASLFDIIWRGRTEWNRKEMMMKMRQRTIEWGREVEKWREGGRW